MKKAILSTCFPFLDDWIESGLIPVFVDKSDAQAFADKLGWPVSDVHYFERPMEFCWIVSRYAPTSEMGVDIEQFHMPSKVSTYGAVKCFDVRVMRSRLEKGWRI